MSARADLHTLLCAMFKRAEIEALAHNHLGPEVAAALPAGTASLEEVAAGLLEAAEHHGVVPELFAALYAVRDNRRAEIAVVEAAWKADNQEAPLHQPRRGWLLVGIGAAVLAAVVVGIWVLFPRTPSILRATCSSEEIRITVFNPGRKRIVLQHATFRMLVDGQVDLGENPDLRVSPDPAFVDPRADGTLVFTEPSGFGFATERGCEYEVGLDFSQVGGVARPPLQARCTP